jgi:uncharacterized protein
VQLNFHPPSGVYYVQRIDRAAIQVNDQSLVSSFLLMPDRISDWQVTSPSQLTAELARELLALEPELILIGTGPKQIFPDPGFLYEPQQHGIGVDVMDNHAACRTYNVLVAEDRKVLMGIILG